MLGGGKFRGFSELSGSFPRGFNTMSFMTV